MDIKAWQKALAAFSMTVIAGPAFAPAKTRVKTLKPDMLLLKKAMKQLLG